MILPEDDRWQFLVVSQSNGINVRRSTFRSRRLAELRTVCRSPTGKKSRSLPFATFLARYRSLLLSLWGVCQNVKKDLK